MYSKKYYGKKCYDHLGGNLGAALLKLYISNGWIELEESKKTVYKITEKGYMAFTKMGLHLNSDNI